MNNLDIEIGKDKNILSALNVDIDQELILAITKKLGPSIFNPKFSIVDFSDNDELTNIKDQFLVKKLGLSNTKTLTDDFNKFISELKLSHINRIVLYAALVKKYKKEAIFTRKTSVNSIKNKHIEILPEVCNGKPIIKGTRISVSLILDKIAAGDTINDLIDAYPNLTKEQISACLTFASNVLNSKFLIPKAS